MTHTTPDPIQEQLIAARRNQILDAATTVFAEKGFERATIKDIAKAAGIADGTIYLYFANKMALLLGILDRLNEPSAPTDMWEVPPVIDIGVFMRSMLRQRLGFFSPNGLQVAKIILSEVLINSELRVLYYERVVAPTFVIADRLLQMWVDEGRIKPFDVQLLVRTMTALVLGLLTLRLMGDATLETQWETLPDMVADLILTGIQPS